MCEAGKITTDGKWYLWKHTSRNGNSTFHILCISYKFCFPCIPCQSCCLLEMCFPLIVEATQGVSPSKNIVVWSDCRWGNIYSLRFYAHSCLTPIRLAPTSVWVVSLCYSQKIHIRMRKFCRLTLGPRSQNEFRKEPCLFPVRVEHGTLASPAGIGNHLSFGQLPGWSCQ